MNKQIQEMACKNCIHYEVCMYVNAQAVEYARAENCKLFRDTAGFHKQIEGEWKPLENYRCFCSACGYKRNISTQFGWKFCPNCGARMKGEEDEKSD
jgi:predicted N-acyltransferase